MVHSVIHPLVFVVVSYCKDAQRLSQLVRKVFYFKKSSEIFRHVEVERARECSLYQCLKM